MALIQSPAVVSGEEASQTSDSANVEVEGDKVNNTTHQASELTPQDVPVVETSTTVGMECDIKNLYQKEDERGRTTWTDKFPDNLDEASENEVTARYAILVRNKKSFDPRKKLEIDSIVIQSPLLKAALSKVLKDYPGKSTSS
jgi:hypothetical protein